MSRIVINLYLVHDYLIMPHQARAQEDVSLALTRGFAVNGQRVGLDMSGNLPAAMAWPGRAGGDITSLTKAATHASAKFGNWK